MHVDICDRQTLSWVDMSSGGHVWLNCGATLSALLRNWDSFEDP